MGCDIFRHTFLILRRFLFAEFFIIFASQSHEPSSYSKNQSAVLFFVRRFLYICNIIFCCYIVIPAFLCGDLFCKYNLYC